MADQERGGRQLIEGARIHLRAVVPADVTDRYCRWMNDPEVVQFLESRFQPSSRETILAYVKKMGDAADYLFLAICLNEGGVHIGNIKIGPIDWIHRFADVSLLIGERDWWGRGLGAEAIGLVVGYAFETLNLHKLTACAYRDNVGSLSAFAKAGFTEEGVRREQRYSAGRYIDDILLGLVNGGDAGAAPQGGQRREKRPGPRRTKKG